MTELPARDVSILAQMAMVAISTKISKSDKKMTFQSCLLDLEHSDSIKIGKYIMDPDLKKKRARSACCITAKSILNWAETNVTEFKNRRVTGTFRADQIKGMKT
jgi:hypothetical protein